MDNKELTSKVCPPLDQILFDLLLKEFINMERRFVLRDWEPATLDGGQFCEIAARIIYHIDSDNLNRRKGVDDCLKYIEDENNSNQHCFPTRRDALHLCKVIRTVYKFRSQRGAIHIDPSYTANEIDSSMLMANVGWLMAEILRIFWTDDTKKVAQAIQEIVRYNVSAIMSIDDKHFVLRTDCTVEEEILLLLHNAGSEGMSRRSIGLAIPKPPPSITKGIARLTAADKREVIEVASKNYVLTPNGVRRVKEELGPKLTLD